MREGEPQYEDPHPGWVGNAPGGWLGPSWQEGREDTSACAQLAPEEFTVGASFDWADLLEEFAAGAD